MADSNSLGNSLSNPLNAPDTHKLIQRFEWNARHVIEDPTALYFRLSRELIGDGKLLVLASHVPPHQPAPNLFFSAVHYLLMRQDPARVGSSPPSPLRDFFPDLTTLPDTYSDPYPAFREFCLTHASEIRKLLETRRVQVNEIGRCAYFLPAFQYVAQRVSGEPFALIEVGSSAGLNLFWDEYAYDYGEEMMYGPRNSEIRLHCKLRGEKRPRLYADFPEVTIRFGIDLHPNDVLDEDAMLWLRALVWPEQIERAKRLEKAIVHARKRPPLLIEGDALNVVPRALDAIARETPIVLFHSFVLNQFSTQARARYAALLTERSAGRLIYDVSLEPKEWPAPLVLTTYQDGKVSEKQLAVCDHLGRWMEWEG